MKTPPKSKGTLTWGQEVALREAQKQARLRARDAEYRERIMRREERRRYVEQECGWTAPLEGVPHQKARPITQTGKRPGT